MLKDLKRESNELVRSFYDSGRNLNGKKLKNYTSGDGSYIGFEGVLDKIIKNVVTRMGLDGRVKVNGDYFNPPKESINEYDPQRLDFHIWKDNKAVLLIESRAWVDKPFYTLKRAVIRNMMELDYVRDNLSDNVEFLVVALSLDIKERLITTMDKTMGYGSRVSQIKLSPYRRGYKKKNYFHFGHVEKSVDKLVEILYNKLNEGEQDDSRSKRCA